MTEGVLVVDKPLGCTSHDVVARARRALGTRKVGHAGTLDPQASGVLVLGVGRATRLLGWLAASDKEYETTIVLGQGTTTDDAAGEVVAMAGTDHLDIDAIVGAARALTGDIRQRPSSVSAIKVDGKRAHARVRAGEDVQLAERSVRVDRFDITGARKRSEGDHALTEVDAVVCCSTGTYVRALARDLGVQLGVGGHVLTLRRTRSGAFSVADAVSGDDIPTDPRLLMPMATAARMSLPSIEVAPEDVERVLHGVRIDWPAEAPAKLGVALLCADRLLAVAHDEGGRATYDAVFP